MTKLISINDISLIFTSEAAVKSHHFLKGRNSIILNLYNDGGETSMAIVWNY